MLPTTIKLGIGRRQFATVLSWTVLLSLAGSSSSASAATAADLCLDPRFRHAAATAIGTWSQLYPFSRVIIGYDGQFGEVQSPQIQQIGSNFVICRASYQLVKTGSSGTAYRVSIDHFTYRVTDTGRSYVVTLEDLVPSLEGTGLSSRDLIARFSVNGRPYADVLEENQRRIEKGASGH